MHFDEITALYYVLKCRFKALAFASSDHMKQIKVTISLNIHEVETSSTTEQLRRRREFTEVSNHRVFQIMKCNPDLIRALFPVECWQQYIGTFRASFLH